MGSCLKPTGTRHDIHLQAEPSLCGGSGYSPHLPGSVWAHRYLWEVLELLANTASPVQGYIAISRPSSSL